MEQSYDIEKTYVENYERGPVFESPHSEVPPTPMKSFLGLPVASRIGIAAGLLLNRKWILEYARRGFDLLTYKTVRSSHRDCYPMPNWVFVEKDADGAYYRIERLPENPADITSSVCFGMPSMAPDVWRTDVERTKKGLGEGKMLIVSVVATPEEEWTVDDVAGDFVKCARWAAESGADVVEANFSCPNVCTSEGSIYLDSQLSGTIAAATKTAIGDTPLLIKTGHFSNRALQADFLRAVNGRADGITMVNCLSREVRDQDGLPVFGESFVQAGILGRGIHEACVENVRNAAGIITGGGLDLAIAAVGGVATIEDMDDYFEAGAGAVLMGSAPMYLPGLAIEAKRARPDW